VDFSGCEEEQFYGGKAKQHLLASLSWTTSAGPPASQPRDNYQREEKTKKGEKKQTKKI